MIYLVSRNKRLFSSEYYTQVSFKEAMTVLEPLVLVQLDTETEGSKVWPLSPEMGIAKWENCVEGEIPNTQPSLELTIKEGSETNS